MKFKIILLLSLIIFSINVFSQSKQQQKALIGTWQVYLLNYGDYYTYQVENDSLIIGEKLKNLILQDSARYDATFFKIISNQAKKFAINCSFKISEANTYSLTIDGKNERQSFSFLPTQIPISSEMSESDIEFNINHYNDYARIKLKSEEIVVDEYDDTLSIAIFLKGFDSFLDEKAHPYVEFVLKK